MRVSSKFISVLFVLLITLPTGGCLGWGWHPFGTPITAAAKADTRISAATNAVLKSVQADVHRTGIALDAAAAGNPRGIQVAKDFNDEAMALIDQAQGAPLPADLSKWSTLTAGLLSEIDAVRTKAWNQRETDRKTILKQADLLHQQTMAKIALNQKVLDYAKENATLADTVRKVYWVIAGIIIFWVVAQLIKFAAPFVPALRGAAAVITGVLAPAASFALHKSESALSGLVSGIGTAIGEIRVAMPERSKEIRAVLDQNLDTKHQVVLGAVANQAVGAASP